MNIAWFVVFRARARSGARLDAPDERALVSCVKEAGSWKVEPELPDVTSLPRRADGGI